VTTRRSGTGEESAPAGRRGGETTVAYVVFGSNIDPEHNLPRALALLSERTRVTATSGVYRTRPVGRQDVPPFLNAAVALRTRLSPAELKFGLLRPIEAELGRVRSADRNAPRTIDLDLVLYGDRIVEEPAAGLMLPDPDIASRAHVVLPLAELAPGLRHPVLGKTLRELAREVGRPAGIDRIELNGWKASVESPARQ